MWELTGEQAVRAFCAGLKAINAMLTTDASVHWWGAILLLQVNGEIQEFKTTGLWPFDNDLEQARRKARAPPLAFKAFKHLLTRRLVVHVSDCACVV